VDPGGEAGVGAVAGADAAGGEDVIPVGGPGAVALREGCPAVPLHPTAAVASVTIATWMWRDGRADISCLTWWRAAD
jgi:hypothetical protein